MKSYISRNFIVVAVMLLVVSSVSARVFYIHVSQADMLKQEGERHYKRNIPLYAYRGDIVDRNGRELAVSAPSVSIWADPSDILDSIDQLAGLSKLIGVDHFSLRRQAEKSIKKDFMYVKRQVSPAMIDAVKKHGSGIFEFINERKRVYPEGSVFSHVVGVTDVDGRGVEGVELVFNAHLEGTDGVKSVIRDRLGRSFEVVDIPRQKKDGQDIALSIDRNIQYIAYSELRHAVLAHDAAKGMLVVLDVKEGKILSMVNYPAYNPNERKTMQPGRIRNRVVTDMFEPGSAIKPFVMAAAFEQGVVQKNDILDVSPGYIDVGDKRIKDARDYGKLDMAGVISRSSNVGMIKISNKLDKDFLAERLRDYGLFSSTGSELPGEAVGIFRPSNEWGSVYKNFLSFGYGVALNALQMANAYLVVANEGVRRDIGILRDKAGSAGVRVMDRQVALQIREMLIGVVEKGGTGVKADTPVYRVAGKTGTAKKLKQGGYSDDSYVAIFSGMAPADNPSIVITIVVDDPKKNGFYGGQVAAPVFSKTASRILRYLDVVPDKTEMLTAVNG